MCGPLQLPERRSTDRAAETAELVSHGPGGWKSKIEVLGSPFLACGPPSPCAPPAMAERDLSSSSYKAMSCQLRTLFTHNYLLEILLPETVPLGLGLQHVDFGDKAQTTHSALGEGTLHDTSLTPNV